MKIISVFKKYYLEILAVFSLLFLLNFTDVEYTYVQKYQADIIYCSSRTTLDKNWNVRSSSSSRFLEEKKFVENLNYNFIKKIKNFIKSAKIMKINKNYDMKDIFCSFEMEITTSNINDSSLFRTLFHNYINDLNIYYNEIYINSDLSFQIKETNSYFSNRSKSSFVIVLFYLLLLGIRNLFIQLKIRTQSEY